MKPQMRGTVVSVRKRGGARVADGDTAGELALWEAEMTQHLAHERRRLCLVAAVTALIGVLVLVGHGLDDAGGRSLMPLGLDDLIVGYPTGFAITVTAGATWLRARVLRGVS